MTIARRVALLLMVVLMLGAPAAAIAFRVWARTYQTPTPVAVGGGGSAGGSGGARIYRVRNGAVDMYAARTVADGGVLLFDAGMDARGAPWGALLAAASADRRDVRALFLTHGHFDHIAAAGGLDGVPVWAGRNDAGLMRGRGGGGQFVTRIFWWLLKLRPVAATGHVDTVREITVSATGPRVLAIPTPGHTAGSVVYLFDGVLFTGDALGFEDGRLVVPGLSFAEDPAAARRSIVQLPRLLAGADVRTICTGHGGCTPPGAAAALLDRLLGELDGTAGDHRGAVSPDAR